MDTRTLLARIAYLQAELAALAALVELQGTPGAPTAPAPSLPRAVVPVVATAPAPAAAAKPGRPAKPGKRAKAPARWSYLPEAVYRLSGTNPFRNGNNLALFDELTRTYGDQPFTRVQLGETLARMQDDGTFTSRQPEQALVISFVQFAGDKGRLYMVDDDLPADLPPPRPKGGRGGSKAASKADTKPTVKRRSKTSS